MDNQRLAGMSAADSVRANNSKKPRWICSWKKASTKFNASAAKRYIRAVATIGGTTPSLACAVSFVGKKQIVP